MLQEITGLKLTMKLIGMHLQIYPQTSAAYHLIRRHAKNENLQRFTYQLPEEERFSSSLPTDGAKIPSRRNCSYSFTSPPDGLLNATWTKNLRSNWPAPKAASTCRRLLMPYPLHSSFPAFPFQPILSRRYSFTVAHVPSFVLLIHRKLQSI
ncbi:hypothetical protein NPIL_310151 [Nephila pilipes]|uniref:Uncharacterized protein n=1 Tax=Nephila pilipes TaxID=299642 RepID=A0A8X6U392_NEPPI|nr:hypothetical protein NPIL_310151 [Nephila pilipes]